jgi:two-component system response regulator YesN
MESQLIIDLVTGLKRKMEKEKKTNLKKKRMQSLINENLIVLKRRFLQSLIENRQKGKPVWMGQQAQDLGLDLSFYKCTPVLCFIDQYKEAKEKFISDEFLRYSIDNVVCELLNKEEKGFSAFYNDSMFFIMHYYKKSPKSGQFQEVKESISEIHSELQRFLKVSITTITGKSCESPEGLINQLKSLIYTSEQRFYMKSGSSQPIEQLNFSPKNIFTWYVAAVQEIQLPIIREDIEGLDKSIQKWLMFIRKNKFHPDFVREWVTKILLDIKLKIHSLQGFETGYFAPVSDNLVTTVETVYELEKMLMKKFMDFIQYIGHISDLPEKGEILKAQKYVLMNLDKKITLTEIAGYLHLNSSYFSRLYKKVTKENFIDYVNKSKMERAKELLDYSNESIEKISEMVGYDSKSYFLKIFKKYFGMSPKDYKYNLLKGSANKE